MGVKPITHAACPEALASRQASFFPTNQRAARLFFLAHRALAQPEVKPLAWRSMRSA